MQSDAFALGPSMLADDDTVQQQYDVNGTFVVPSAHQQDMHHAMDFDHHLQAPPGKADALQLVYQTDSSMGPPTQPAFAEPPQRAPVHRRQQQQQQQQQDAERDKLAQDMSIMEFFSPALQPNAPEMDDDEDEDWTPLVSPALGPVGAPQPPPLMPVAVPVHAGAGIGADGMLPQPMYVVPVQAHSLPRRTASVEMSPMLSPMAYPVGGAVPIKRTPSSPHMTSMSPSPGPKRLRTPRGKIVDPTSAVPPITLEAPMLSPMLSPYMGYVVQDAPQLIQESPRMRPQASPQIRPIIKGPSAADTDRARMLTAEDISKLETRSNYQNLLLGSTKVLGVSDDSDVVQGVGQRKLVHKNAEQRRRDCLKSGYEELRDLVPSCDKNASKVDILRKTTEYLHELLARVRTLETENAALRHGKPVPAPAAASQKGRPAQEEPKEERMAVDQKQEERLGESAGTAAANQA